MEHTFDDRILIGFYERVTILGKDQDKEVMARIDTGATKSSIDSSLAKELELGPVVKSKIVKSAHGRTKRAIISLKIKLDGKEFRGDFTIADRSHMKYRVLIGQNILTRGFLIDPLKK